MKIRPEFATALEQQLTRAEQLGTNIGGWKLGLTSGKMRDSMGVGFRPFGHINESRIFSSGSRISLSEVGDIGVENELVFTFGEDVPADASRDQVIHCIKGISAGFELNERRLPTNASVADRIVDNLSNWGIVVGRLITDWKWISIDDLYVTLFQDGTRVEAVASFAHIDAQLQTLMTLSAVLARFNKQISKGDRVITGAFTRQRVTEPSLWRGDFGTEIGSVEVEWT